MLRLESSNKSLDGPINISNRFQIPQLLQIITLERFDQPLCHDVHQISFASREKVVGTLDHGRCGRLEWEPLLHRIDKCGFGCKVILRSNDKETRQGQICSGLCQVIVVME